MNLAELIGELESAVTEAKVAGERVRQAIVHLKEIFGSIGPQVTIVEPTIPMIPLEELMEDSLKCPKCGRHFPPYRNKPGSKRKSPRHERLARHLAIHTQRPDWDGQPASKYIPR